MFRLTLKSTILAAAATAVAISSAMVPAPAEAGIKEMKFHMIDTDPPYMDMHFENGKWVWKSKSKSFGPDLKVRIKSSRKILQAHIQVFSANTKQASGMLWKWQGKPTKHIEGVTGMHINGNTLKTSYDAAAGLCHFSGGSKKVIRAMNMPAKISARTKKDGWKSRWSNIAIRVICNAKPAPKRNTVALKLTNMRLYDAPNKSVHSCGEKIMMVGEFWTNKPGKVNFIYQRGDGEKRTGTVTTKKVKGGYAGLWSTNYTFNGPVDRKYMIIAKGHPMSTNWVPLKVSC